MKDVIGIGLLSTLLFPVILVVILVMKGVIHVQMGMTPEAEQKVKQYVEPLTPAQAAADEQQAPSWEAAQRKSAELAAKEEEIKKETERLETLKNENQKMLIDLDSSKSHLAKAFDADAAEASKKIEQLASIYGAMKPVEAAPILLNLSDQKVAQILSKIPEPRTQGKLLAAMGALNQERAAEVSRIVGYKTPTMETPNKGNTK